MSRPAFQLSDDQARILRETCATLCDQFPVDPRDHRPFTRAFIRAVHQATGKTFGPDIYRRLLKVYGEKRSPSNDTLAAERRAFDDELLARPQLATQPAADVGGTQVVSETRTQGAETLRLVLEEYLPHLARHRGPAQVDAYVDFLTARLAESEQALAAAQENAARLAGKLMEQTALATARLEHVAEMRAALGAQVDATTRLSAEVEAMRRHSLLQIDAVRGETRVVQERCATLQATIKQKDAEIDMLRMRGAGSAAPGGIR